MKRSFLLIFLFSICLNYVANAQFKNFELEPSTNKKIQLKPQFIPGKSTIPKDKQIPLNINSMDVNSLINRVTRVSPTSFNKDGEAIFFRGFTQNQKGLSIQDQVDIYMNNVNPYMNQRNISSEYEIVTIDIDEIGMSHIHVKQVYKGISVEGGEMKLHAEKEIITSANGRFLPTPKLSNTTPTKTMDEAFEIVKNDFVSKDIFKRIDANQQFLINKNQFEGQLIIIYEGDLARLAYKVEAYANVIQQFVYFIDANTGEIIKEYKNYCSFHGQLHEGEEHIHAEFSGIKSPIKEDEQKLFGPDGPKTATAKDLKNIDRLINTYESSNSFYMVDASRPMFNGSLSKMPNEPVGVIWTIDAFNTNPENNNFEYDHVTSSNNSWNNKTAVSAHYNGGEAFLYFRNVHNRNSINGEGGNIVSLINISDPQSGGGFDNAFWNGAAMFYGNGDTAFDALAKALDVAGHEMSHGVVQATANLTYQGESGAMNEAFADIFGAMIDREDWFMGEDVVKTSTFPSGKLRDMSDPHNGGTKLGDPGWQPKHTNEQYNGSQDNGGVHINSGIVNHAYYLFAETSGIGKEKAEKIFYRALTNYLTKSSKFVDLRAAVEKAATDLYSDTEKNAASTAFQMVGIGGGGGTTDYETDVEMNPGEDFLLHSDGSLSNLYIRDNNLNLIADPLSNVDHISKPSVTDNGEIIFFVGSDNNIYVITIDWQSGNAGINTFDDQGVWRNVAISKDGRRLAAITNQISNSIIVVDFEIQNQKTFELYNPTYTEGVSSGNVDYSDAMEFDFTGEWLIYDAQSTINGASGDIVYWDIGFLNVFDNNSNTFAEGKVEKLFNQLPVNTSVGNPTFSKNSPYIIAFDLIEGSTYKIMGANIEQNKVSEIFENGNLGYPSFNNADNQLVYEWNWLFGTDIGLSSLESDKITSVFGSETVIVEDSKRPVVFSNGERTIVGDKETEIVMDFTIYPNPTSDYIRVELTDNNEIERIDIYDATGRSVFSKQEVDGNQVIDVREWNGGIYSVQITSKKGDNKLKTFVKI